MSAARDWAEEDWLSFLEEVEAEDLMTVCDRYGVGVGDAVDALNRLSQNQNRRDNGERERLARERKEKASLPWSRRQNEGPNAFEAFKIFCNLGPNRTIEGAFNHPKTPATLRAFELDVWFEWAERMAWKERVAAYDEHKQVEAAQMAASVCTDSIAQRKRLYDLSTTIMIREMALILEWQQKCADAIRNGTTLPAHELDTKGRPVIPGSTIEQGQVVRYTIQLLKQYHLDVDRMSDLASGEAAKAASGRASAQGQWAHGPTPRAASKAPAVVQSDRRKGQLNDLLCSFRILQGGQSSDGAKS